LRWKGRPSSSPPSWCHIKRTVSGHLILFFFFGSKSVFFIRCILNRHWCFRTSLLYFFFTII
jgi:hypothetical protein